MGPYPSDFDLFLVTAAGNASENGTVDGFQMKGLNVNISFEVTDSLAVSPSYLPCDERLIFCA